MSELSKTYAPDEVEPRWYQRWLDDKAFQADPARVSEKRPAYSIVIPPPNVTGILTLGHVLNNTIQDILARRARMLGKEVLWLPGTDHAGIATQNVVEKTLKKQGVIKHRDDLGREKLVEKIWDWKEKHGGIIIEQLKKLGCSCDWSRERFTMDPDYSRCVAKIFVDLYKKGLIYRGKRMVNWCPSSLTALSDEEVVMKEQKGFMYHFKVEVVEKDGQQVLGKDGKPLLLEIATTRPETIPADTAVAVNPNDSRYKELVGKYVVRALPLDQPREQRIIPIIADDHVTFDFGTGVLKVTPAHDKADFEIWGRQMGRMLDAIEEASKGKPSQPTAWMSLTFPEVIDERGMMTVDAGVDLAGLDRFAARKKAHEILEAAGALEKAEPYVNNVGFSERADVQIESFLKEQWFLKYPKVTESQACVTDGRMRFFPDRWAKVYDHWLNGIQDWCISRQLWWGHRVPIWSGYLTDQFVEGISAVAGGKLKGTPYPHKFSGFTASFAASENLKAGADVSLSNKPGHTTFFRFSGENGQPRSRKDGADEVSAATFSEHEAAELERLGFTQDPDVLDTWFSSWLWPFATMGWTMDKEKDAANPLLKAFYPTTDLVTGPDIIFFWVARMIMAGFEWMGEMPFKNVYFTGIIRDKQGRKMSKSLGNSPDPLDLIARYSADALRFGIMRSAPLGQDICFDEKNVELGRNFCTKLWNAARFRQMQTKDEGGRMTDENFAATSSEDSSLIPHPSSFVTEAEINGALLSSDDKWILLRLNTAITEVTAALEDYRFSDATATLYRFFWSEYCDWYVEASKATLQGSDVKRKANTLAVMDFVIGQTLRLFHPFLPFITEELWHGMGFNKDMPEDQGGKSIMTAPWPKPLDADELAHFGILPEDEKAANDKYEAVNLGRGLKSTFNIASNKRVGFVFRPNKPLPAHELSTMTSLSGGSPFTIPDTDWIAPKGTPIALTPLGELFLPLEGLIDASAERERVGKELAKVEAELGKVRAKLADENFAKKVPAKVLEDHQQREADWAAQLAKLKTMLDALG